MEGTLKALQKLCEDQVEVGEDGELTVTAPRKVRAIGLVDFPPRCAPGTGSLSSGRGCEGAEARCSTRRCVHPAGRGGAPSLSQLVYPLGGWGAAGGASAPVTSQMLTCSRAAMCVAVRWRAQGHHPGGAGGRARGVAVHPLQRGGPALHRGAQHSARVQHQGERGGLVEGDGWAGQVGTQRTVEHGGVGPRHVGGQRAALRRQQGSV